MSFGQLVADLGEERRVKRIKEKKRREEMRRVYDHMVARALNRSRSR